MQLTYTNKSFKQESIGVAIHNLVLSFLDNTMRKVKTQSSDLGSILGNHASDKPFVFRKHTPSNLIIKRGITY
jgi:hypothetical protein